MEALKSGTPVYCPMVLPTCCGNDGEGAVLPREGPEPQSRNRFSGLEGVQNVLLGVIQANIAVGQRHQEACRRPSMCTCVLFNSWVACNMSLKLSRDDRIGSC